MVGTETLISGISGVGVSVCVGVAVAVGGSGVNVEVAVDSKVGDEVIV